MSKKEFIHVVDTMTIHIETFLNTLLSFLNSPEIKSLIKEKHIALSGKVFYDKVSRIYIQGTINDVIGYLDVIPRDYNLLPETKKLWMSIETKEDHIRTDILQLKKIRRDLIEKSIHPAQSVNKAFVIRIFLQRNLPAKLIFLVRNFVLTST